MLTQLCASSKKRVLCYVLHRRCYKKNFALSLRCFASYKQALRPCSHYSVFVNICFCCIEATVHTTLFSYKNGEKNLRFCAFTLICPITKTQRKTSVFVCSHYSVFVKLIVGYWSFFKNLRFCAFTLIKCLFKNLRFCGYPLLTAFSKTSVFVAFLCGSV